MVGMKYNWYLIGGVTLLTILLLFLFAGAVAEDKDMLKANGINTSEHGYGSILLGIGLPLILATIYVFARNRKDKPMKK